MQHSITFNASWISILHTVFASSSFLAALAVGSYLHYYKIVENASFGHPDEWFPSVSATIGDRYPERSIFQIIIALTAGPRFLMLAFDFISLYRPKSYLPFIALTAGVLRTFTAGGWMYITSTDDHDAHDVFMIGYIVLTIPWTVCITLLSPKGSFQRKARFYSAVTFFGTIAPLIYWFIQHKVHVRPGAYSVYAYFEWGLIALDILFDSWSYIDFTDIDISISGEGVKVISGQQEKKKPAIQKIAPNSAENEDGFTTVETVANLINSYMYWTVVTSLFVCVWYFPLWDLGLTGYEAVIVSLFLAPLLLVPTGLRHYLAANPHFARSLTIILGIGSYKIEDPEKRLLTITAGTMFAVASLVNELWSLAAHPKKLNSYIATFTMGLLATSIFKFLNYSNNPIWPIMHKENGGYNSVGIFLGLLGALLTPVVDTTVAPKTSTSSSSTSSSSSSSSSPPPLNAGGSLLLGALGFGGYYFALHAFLSDSGTLVLWTWEGFPIRGPTPVTGALPHLVTFAVSILIASRVHPNFFSNLTYNLVIGAGSTLATYFLKGWTGFAGSLVYSFYLVSLAPVIFQSINGYNPVATFFIGFLVNIIMSLASVWIVAYAFVPYGPLLRERTDLIVGTSLVLIYAGVFNYKLRSDRISKLEFISKKTMKQLNTLTTVLLALAITATIKRAPLPFNQIKSYNEPSGSFTAGIWCVHFGLDNDMWSSETRMRDLIRDAQVDIIGLLETDTQRLIGGNRDFTQKIAEDLGMYVDYGPGPNKHTWGAALLSKFPIIQSTHHLLPSPVGELAPAIHATLDIYGTEVDVVVFHSGQEEDVEDRRLQSLGVEEIMAKSQNPLVLLSYLVTDPLVGNYLTYTSDQSRMHDIDSTDWDRWCEYIMFRELKKVAYARISRSTITDTELQIAKFKLLSDEEKENFDADFFYSNNFVEEEDIDSDLRMPQIFKGDGVRGHRYHVFDKPKYFAQEKH
ncbi:CWH43 [Candida oxycetoniae]|uniref:CWH43 n=1 Tax=Candida oxycetoniae TaxID=497107 RepID=A0AAI9WXA3_9ASCO|nr:CWH43 [Candida oxycetoniae]KAI3404032.2 CWH43 [Candida oxycetoniae]